MLTKIALSIGLFMTGGLELGNERILCEVHDLDSQGFEQMGEYPEFVCENIFDDTDFVVVVDEFDEFRVGDILNVELNPCGELVDYEVLNITEM